MRKTAKKPAKQQKRATYKAPTISQLPAQSLGDAPITITLGQFKELEGRASAAEERAAKLEAKLITSRAEDPTDRVMHLTELVRLGLLPVMRFAIANLPPSEIPKWPFRAVEEIWAGLVNLPDFSEDDKILMSELDAFVDDIKEHELARARKRDALIANAPSAI